MFCDPMKPEEVPETIYLTFGYCDEICWCSDKINDEDIEYTKGTPKEIAKQKIEEYRNTINVTDYEDYRAFRTAVSLEAYEKWLEE